jgi:hypothetical protein
MDWFTPSIEKISVSSPETEKYMMRTTNRTRNTPPEAADTMSSTFRENPYVHLSLEKDLLLESWYVENSVRLFLPNGDVPTKLIEAESTARPTSAPACFRCI